MLLLPRLQSPDRLLYSLSPLCSEFGEDADAGSPCAEQTPLDSLVSSAHNINAGEYIYGNGTRTLTRENITQLLTAIGDPARLEILFLLASRDRLNVGDITAQFRLSQPAISHHLRVLREAGAVQSEKVGQEVFYQLAGASVVGRLREITDMFGSCK